MRIPGSWTIARPYGVPIRIHWSVPVCALLAGGLHLAPGAWLAYLLLVLLHEAGHAYVVHRVGARPIALEVLGFGGLCWWKGTVTPIQRACIAWGGVWAQLLVLAVAGVAVLALGKPGNLFAADMVDVALVSNLWLIGVNLLPIPPLDGKEAWQLVPLLRRRFAARAAMRGVAAQPATAAPGARFRFVRVVAPRLDPATIARPTRADAIDDGFDEHSLTPEVEDVLERVRSIVAREASRDPKPPGNLQDQEKGGAGDG